ncbi:MAG: AMP-binding protein [Cyclobacteriaceae bacterium]|nr:AMP-binding protein [Cyclobacteriaceae bacterium]
MADFPWIAQYPKGIPAKIEIDQYNSLLELFEECFENYADRPAYENMGKILTYGQIDSLSTNFAAYLQHEFNLKKGDRIAIQMPNCLQYPIALIGSLKAGLVVVNTNPLYTPREMEHQFKDAEVSAILVISNFASNLEKVLPNIDTKKIIVTGLGDMLGGLKGALVNFVVKKIKKMVPKYNIPMAVSFKQVLKKGAKYQYVRPEMNKDDLAFLQYTGGTTGVSKGAMLSHRNIVNHTIQINHWFSPLMKESDREVILTAIPLYHIFALTVNGILFFKTGAKNVLITNPRDMPGFIKELKKHQITIFTGVNTLFNGLLNQKNINEVDFSKLKASIGGGMAVQDFVAKKWKEVTGCTLCEGYGLSETSPVLSVNPLDRTEQIGTIGLPMPSTEMGIFDEEGKQLKQGEIGEICARGPQVMSGYWKLDNNGVFFDKEWFRTGDVGMMQEDGFFKIVDRKKDMINVSGFNVYPNEIENVLADHPKVLEVAVVGVPDAKSTEVVKAFIVKSDPSLTEEEINQYCNENLTGYKQPKHVEFRAELPKSNVGKILRRILKEEIN